jgi:hypothetical protein
MVDMDLAAIDLQRASEVAWRQARDAQWLTLRGVGLEDASGSFPDWLQKLARKRLAVPGTRTSLLTALDRDAFERRYPGLLALQEGEPSWRFYVSCAGSSVVDEAKETGT